MKKNLFFFLLLIPINAFSQTYYDFSCTIPSGQTIYFAYENSNPILKRVSIVEPSYWGYNGLVMPSGNLLIPDSILYNGVYYSIVSIEYGAFSHCPITSVELSESITNIGDYAFNYCTYLTSVSLPSTLQSIGDYAFYGCDSLNSLVIPGNVQFIGTQAMNGVSEIYYYGLATGSPWGALNHYNYYFEENGLFYYDSIKTILLGCDETISNLVIPNSVIIVKEGAFANRSNITSVSLGNAILNIEGTVFYGCTGLSSLVIPNSVRNIGQSAFAECNYLSSIIMGDSIDTIGLSAFSDCSALYTVALPNSLTYLGSNAFNNCTSLSTASLGNSLTAINDGTFSGCTSIINITLPNTVTSIGNGSFRGCSGLSEITIPENVTNIGMSAFVGCNNIATVNFNATNCRQTGYSFQNLPNLTTLNIGNSVQYIPPYMFRGCSGLISLNIPDAVTGIADGAFTECSNLTSAAIGNGVSSIGNSVFAQCTRLTNVILGESIETIGNSAFQNCGIIGELVIPQGVISIGHDGFKDCFGITEITCLGRVAPTLGTDAFDGVDTSITVNIPCGTTNLYSGRWSYFHNFNEIPFLFNVASADLAMGTVAMLQEPTCEDPVAIVEATPRNSYRFDHWSDGSTANPYTYTAMGSLTLTAYFASTTESIDDIEDSGIILYTKDYQIHIDEAIGEKITVYTIDGRTIASLPKATEHVAIPVTTAGVYIVKVGDHPARKVVVIR